MLARIEEVRGRPEEALETLGEGLRANPANTLLLRTKANLMIALQDFDGATELLEDLRSSDPSDPAVAADLGNLYAEAGRYAQAVPLLLEASEAGYNSPEVLFRLGEGQLRLDRRSDAISTFLLMQTLHPEHGLTLRLERMLQ